MDRDSNIQDRVIHGHGSNAEAVFVEETAGISEHPAELLGSSSDISESEPFSVMLEKMGVTDPECDRMPIPNISPLTVTTYGHVPDDVSDFEFVPPAVGCAFLHPGLCYLTPYRPQNVNHHKRSLKSDNSTEAGPSSNRSNTGHGDEDMRLSRAIQITFSHTLSTTPGCSRNIVQL